MHPVHGVSKRAHAEFILCPFSSRLLVNSLLNLQLVVSHSSTEPYVICLFPFLKLIYDLQQPTSSILDPHQTLILRWCVTEESLEVKLPLHCLHLLQASDQMAAGSPAKRCQREEVSTER